MPEPGTPRRTAKSTERKSVDKRLVAGAAAMGLAAAVASNEFGRPGGAPTVEENPTEQAGDTPARHSGSKDERRALQPPATYEVDPGLNEEDTERAREHGPFKDQVMEQIILSLEGTPYVVGTVVEVEGERIYDDFINIWGPNGELGSLYPDEATGELTFRPSDSLSDWVNYRVGSPLDSYTFTDPQEIRGVMAELQDIQTLQQTEQEQYRNTFQFGQQLEDRLQTSAEVKELVEANDRILTVEENQTRQAPSDTGQ